MKEKTTDLGKNMDEPHFAKLKTPDSKGCVVYDSINATFCKRQNYRERKQINGFQVMQGSEEGTDDKGPQGNFLDRHDLHFDCRAVLT